MVGCAVSAMYLWPMTSSLRSNNHLLDPPKEQTESAIIKVCKSLHMPKGKTKEVKVSVLRLAVLDLANEQPITFTGHAKGDDLRQHGKSVSRNRHCVVSIENELDMVSEAVWVVCCAAGSNDAKFAQRQSLTTDAPTHRLASLLAGQVGDRLDRT